LDQLKKELDENGLLISPPTIRRLLKKNNFSLRVNMKNKRSKKNDPDRNRQFEYIKAEKIKYQEKGFPVISVDSKKKELIGDFKNAGRHWCKKADEVYVHDFPGDAIGKAVPYGVYDISQNKGHIFVGVSSDTAEFAVDAIASWWEQEGQLKYPGQNELLILGDSGGSNSCRSRLFKKAIQRKLCDRFSLNVTLSHYPSGCSKWNPIEHRLFSYISINWAGRPLRSYELMLGYMNGTKTRTGLKVRAQMLSGEYKTGNKVSDKELESLNISRHKICPKLNYTIRPAKENREVDF